VARIVLAADEIPHRLVPTGRQHGICMQEQQPFAPRSLGSGCKLGTAPLFRGHETYSRRLGDGRRPVDRSAIRNDDLADQIQRTEFRQRRQAAMQEGSGVQRGDNDAYSCHNGVM